MAGEQLSDAGEGAVRTLPSNPESPESLKTFSCWREIMKITRSSKIHSLILAAALGTGLGFVSPVSAQAVHSYILDSNGKGLTELGTKRGGSTYVTDINDAGQVVGYSNPAGDDHWHAFIAGADSAGMTDLGTLGGERSYAWDINDTGQVVGSSYTATGVSHAFITGPNGVGMTVLNSLLEFRAGL